MKEKPKDNNEEKELRDMPPNETAAETGEAKAAKEVSEAEKRQAEANAEIEKLKKELADLNEKYIRVLAEYDNFRKRTQREKDQLWNDATASAVTKMLPILDNFERSAQFETTDAAYKKGIDLIGASFKETLDKMEVKEIPTVGEKFDPALHDAIAHVENDDVGEETIVDCFRKGYTIGDKVIRHAMVQVAN